MSEKETQDAIKRLNDIYKIAMEKGDMKTALQAQREIDKLGGLHNEENPDENNIDKESLAFLKSELDAIAEHLLPLELASEDYPLREHARIASERIREGQSFGET